MNNNIKSKKAIKANMMRMRKGLKYLKSYSKEGNWDYWLGYIEALKWVLE